MEIAKNIKIIDNLQCQLLSLVSQLFLSMQNSDMTTAERAEILAGIEVILYLLSEKLGVSVRLISYWENGERECDFKTLISIADLFSTSVDYLLGRTDY